MGDSEQQYDWGVQQQYSHYPAYDDHEQHQHQLQQHGGYGYSFEPAPAPASSSSYPASSPPFDSTEHQYASMAGYVPDPSIHAQSINPAVASSLWQAQTMSPYPPSLPAPASVPPMDQPQPWGTQTVGQALGSVETSLGHPTPARAPSSGALASSSVYSQLPPQPDKLKPFISAEGTSFIVSHCDRLVKEVLPRHFQHSNIQSFTRQLNVYEFTRLPLATLLAKLDLPAPSSSSSSSTSNDHGTAYSGWSHPQFVRGNQDELIKMKPRPSKARQKKKEEKERAREKERERLVAGMNLGVTGGGGVGMGGPSGYRIRDVGLASDEASRPDLLPRDDRQSPFIFVAQLSSRLSRPRHPPPTQNRILHPCTGYSSYWKVRYKGVKYVGGSEMGADELEGEEKVKLFFTDRVVVGEKSKVRL
ncbi:hypothetical protein MNV49_001832, partial [Pseudohyphozyma bogoriensis]